MLSERFLEFPSRVRLGSPKPYNSGHLKAPEHFQNSLPPVRLGTLLFFRSGSGEGLSESVMEFPAVLGVFLNNGAIRLPLSCVTDLATRFARIDSRESFAIQTPIFIARQADSPESVKFLIRANHATKFPKCSRSFVLPKKFGSPGFRGICQACWPPPLHVEGKKAPSEGVWTRKFEFVLLLLACIMRIIKPPPTLCWVLELPIRANRVIRANRANRFARITPLRLLTDF